MTTRPCRPGRPQQTDGRSAGRLNAGTTWGLTYLNLAVSLLGSLLEEATFRLSSERPRGPCNDYCRQENLLEYKLRGTGLSTRQDRGGDQCGEGRACWRLPPAEGGGGWRALVLCSEVSWGFVAKSRNLVLPRGTVGSARDTQTGSDAASFGCHRAFLAAVQKRLRESMDGRRETGVNRLHEAPQKDDGSAPGWDAGRGDRRLLCRSARLVTGDLDRCAGQECRMLGRGRQENRLIFLISLCSLSSVSQARDHWDLILC